MTTNPQQASKRPIHADLPDDVRELVNGLNDLARAGFQGLPDETTFSLTDQSAWMRQSMAGA